MPARAPIGSVDDEPSVEPRRLFRTVPGPEGCERTLFRTVDWEHACGEEHEPPPVAAVALLLQVVEQRRVLREQQAGVVPWAVGEAARPPRGRRSSRPGGLMLAAVLGVGALVAAVGSLAYFTSAGSGSGSVTVGAISALTFSPGSVPTSSLVRPGGSGAVVLKVGNPNGAAVRFPSLVLDTALGSGGFAASGCTLAQAHLAFTATASTLSNGGLGWTVPAGATAYPITLADAISMGTGAADACQSATFSVYLKAGP